MKQLVQKYLKEQASLQLLRQHKPVEALGCLNFTSNDYLCLSQHEEVIAALKDGADKYGVGSGGSACISGYTSAHQCAEETFAAFLKREEAILFPSGYHANFGVITSFVNRNTQLIIDRLSHASIIDAAIMSRAKFKRYPHNNISRCKESAEVICTEGVFSMEGDIAPLRSIVNFAKRKESLLILDDAHALGVIALKGSIDFHGLANHDIPILVNPLGKAVGIMGAFVSGTRDYMEYIRQKARSYKYTTSLSPATACAITKSIELMQYENWRQAQLQSLIHIFVVEAKARHLKYVSEDNTAIQSIIVPSISQLLSVQKMLLEKNILIAAIRPPTVPKGSSRIRISLNINHTKQEIIYLLDSLSEALEKWKH